MTSSTSFGKPGTIIMHQSMTPVVKTTRWLESNWRMKSSPSPASEPERVTRIPAEAEISSAGIWETRPSPTLSSENCWTDSSALRPICSIPMAKPPMRLMPVMSTPAMASPRTNLLAPSIAP